MPQNSVFQFGFYDMLMFSFFQAWLDGADWVKMVVKTTKYEHKNVVVN